MADLDEGIRDNGRLDHIKKALLGLIGRATSLPAYDESHHKTINTEWESGWGERSWDFDRWRKHTKPAFERTQSGASRCTCPALFVTLCGRNCSNDLMSSRFRVHVTTASGTKHPLSLHVYLHDGGGVYKRGVPLSPRPPPRPPSPRLCEPLVPDTPRPPPKPRHRAVQHRSPSPPLEAIPPSPSPPAVTSTTFKAAPVPRRRVVRTHSVHGHIHEHITPIKSSHIPPAPPPASPPPTRLPPPPSQPQEGEAEQPPVPPTSPCEHNLCTVCTDEKKCAQYPRCQQPPSRETPTPKPRPVLSLWQQCLPLRFPLQLDTKSPLASGS